MNNFEFSLVLLLFVFLCFLFCFDGANAKLLPRVPSRHGLCYQSSVCGCVCICVHIIYVCTCVLETSELWRRTDISFKWLFKIDYGVRWTIDKHEWIKKYATIDCYYTFRIDNPIKLLQMEFFCSQAKYNILRNCQTCPKNCFTLQIFYNYVPPCLTIVKVHRKMITQCINDNLWIMHLKALIMKLTHTISYICSTT